MFQVNSDVSKLCFQLFAGLKTVPMKIRGVSVFVLMIDSLFNRLAIQTINSACFLESIDINLEFWFSQNSLLCHQSCKASFK